MGIREVQERVSERIEKVPGRYVDGTVKASRVAERGRQRTIENSVVMCVCDVCVCMRASVCARACVLGLCISANVCVCVCVCVCACVRCFVHVHTISGTSLYRPKERPELSVAFEFDPWISFYNYMTTLGEKKLMRKEFANSF